MQINRRPPQDFVDRPSVGFGSGVAPRLPDLPTRFKRVPVDVNSPPVVVVMDGGVDAWHEDLDGAMWRNPGEIENDGIDNDQNGTVDDFYGVNIAFNTKEVGMATDVAHGTHVAGIIAAEDNGIGVTGVAGGVAKVMAVAGMYERYDLTSTFENAVEYVVRMKERFGVNIRVVNASFGGGFVDPEKQRRWVAAVQRLADADILLVAATSNAYRRDMNGKPDFPANVDLPNVITVAALNRRDSRLALFSSKGDQVVEVAAPGSGIKSTVPKNRYRRQSGTSMAAPYVAGAAARVLAKNPKLTAAQVREILMSTVTKLDTLEGMVSTGGKVNVEAAEAEASHRAR